MNNSVKTPEIFKYGSTWLQADFHLHTKADNEFKYSDNEDYYFSNYVDGLENAQIRLGVIANHNKFDTAEFKTLKKRASKKETCLLPGVELSVNDGSNGVHTLIVFSDQWLENGNDYISPFITTMFPGKSKSEYQNENGRSDKNILQAVEELEKTGRDYFNPLTEISTINGKRILIIDVAKGINKPYQDKNGVIWVKNGSDKRKATSREELQRLFQNSSLVHADEVAVQGSTINDIDLDLFSKFFEKEFEERLKDQGLPVIQVLENMNLVRKGEFNLACFLLFGKNNKFKLPTYLVKCVCYHGNSIDEENYIESQDNTGTILDIFKKTTAFLSRNIRSIQRDQGVNSIGIKEIPNIVFEELVTNALIHRDYFVSASIRVFIFSDRIEIISPGHLPNNLTVENIKAGNSNIRNPILTSFATKLLPYRGLGNGVRRALKVYPDIDFIDDREGNQFKCIIKRVIS